MGLGCLWSQTEELVGQESPNPLNQGWYVFARDILQGINWPSPSSGYGTPCLFSQSTVYTLLTEGNSGKMGDRYSLLVFDPCFWCLKRETGVCHQSLPWSTCLPHRLSGHYARPQEMLPPPLVLGVLFSTQMTTLGARARTRCHLSLT